MHLSRGKLILVSILGVALGLWLFVDATFDQHIALFRRKRGPDPFLELWGSDAILAGIVGLVFAGLCGTILVLSIRRRKD